MVRRDGDHEPDQITERTRLSPGPEQPTLRPACVVVIHGEGLGRRADLGDDPVTVGRSRETDLCIDHPSVSRAHCRIERDGDGYRLVDLGATNPILLNDRPAACAPLADGDHVTVGESILKFIGQESVEARYHEEVYQLATHDALTNLHNRRHFVELADKEIARALRHGRPLTLGIVDIDLFKEVNDRHGHIAGDGVLREIGAVLRQHLRGGDIAARVGGEEFAILLPECALEPAARFAERLRAAVASTRFEPGGEARRITVSTGLAQLRPDRDSFSLLMRAADAALYRAKDGGRNRVELEH
ncbi:GGDEF domain-containing protein [Luteimonas sp. SJ-92]|uniref:diguanylate cyclase n=1 Tax=Luteimonas salinisoli TaxID=2752307 RepID=A0A853J9V1_9GAMM|nr:GGDEF domain-containing protein [Luteimonas salinisoli]NZA25420.1 GGDEF domain-containing protein [Luteimonas salinisoli]